MLNEFDCEDPNKKKYLELEKKTLNVEGFLCIYLIFNNIINF